MHSPVGLRPQGSPARASWPTRSATTRNFTWLNGSFLLDWLIHNLDVCCWVKGAWPVSCQGQGGRQVRTLPDQLFDHYVVEYTFPDGTRLIAEGRHMDQCWGFFGDVIHGAKGCAVLGEGITEPEDLQGPPADAQEPDLEIQGPPCNHYQVEHDLLFEAIRHDKPYNEAERCGYAALVGIMGRMAAESGKLVTWDEALHSNIELAPGLDKLTMAVARAGQARRARATTRSPCRGSRPRFERSDRAAGGPAERGLPVAIPGHSRCCQRGIPRIMTWGAPDLGG